MKKKLITIALPLLILSVCILYLGNDLLIRFESKDPSQSMGTTADGS